MTGGRISGEAIRIEVNGRIFQGWKSAQVVSGLDQIATQFALAVTREYPGGDSVRVRPGDLVRVLIGDDLVATGYADKCPISYDGSRITVSVSGRSRAGDIVDSCITTEIKAGKTTTTAGGGGWPGIKYRADGSAVPAARVSSQWRTIDAKRTISALIAPYGLKLYSEDARSIVISNTSVSKGTKVAEAIKKLIQSEGLIVTDTESGDIRLVSLRAPEKASGAVIASLDGSGTNVLSGSCQFDYSNAYSSYEVYGQAKPSKASRSPSAEYNVRGEASSGVFGARTRTLRVFESGDADASGVRDRAAYEAATRESRAKTAEYKLAGWRQPDGSLWRKGALVRVKDQILGFDEWMLIGSVTFDMSDSGCTTTLKVAPIGAYSQTNKDSWRSAGERDGKAAVGATKTEAGK